MSNAPRVSIVIPSYNNGKYVERTMRSVLDQTFTDFEMIVSDHSSSDNTWEVLQQFRADPRVRLDKITAGGGALRNWAHVSGQATGEYLKLVCADDLLYPEALQRQVDALDAHPGASMSAFCRDVIDAHDRPVVKARGLGRLKGLVDGRRAARQTIVAGANLYGEPMCVLFRREVFERVGGWETRFPFVVDEASYVRVLGQGDLVALAEPLGGFRLSRSQWSVHLAQEQSNQVVAWHGAVAKEIPGLLSRRDLIVGNALARAMAYVRRAAYIAFDHRMGR